MYKIILVCCLVVLAAAEGHLSEDEIKLAQQRYSQMLQNDITILNNNRNDFYTKINQIQQNLLKMPEINIDQNGECPTEYEDMKKQCYSKIERFCKSTLTFCHNEVKVQEQRFWDSVVTAKNKLRDFEKNFEVNIEDCKNTYNISTSDYEKCVTDLISTINKYEKPNLFDRYLYSTKKYVQNNRKAVLDFLGKTYETKSFTSVYINNKWYPIYENAC